MSKQKTARILLRLGIAFVFFYAAVSAFLNPNSWIGFFPVFLRSALPTGRLLLAFSFYQLILGFWILSGKRAFLAGLISSATILGIVVFNFNALDIIFRDIGLFFAALALAFLSRRV